METLLNSAGIPTIITSGPQQTAALRAVVEEREFQDRKHGSPSENPHSVGSWLLTIRQELLEAEAAAVKGGEGRDNVISEITQIAALCVACLEQHGVEPITGRTV